MQLRCPRTLLRLAGDERLVALVRAGDPVAFEVLYDRHAAKLLSFCRHMLGSLQDAEDALQRTFFSAYHGLAVDERPIELRPWLYAIARNECLSALRQRRFADPLDLAGPATEGLSAQIERREELRALLADLRGLPEPQRAALLLSELGGFTHAQIASIVGGRPDQVKAYVFQARSNLIAEREARERSCVAVREELAGARGAALLQRGLRRHLHQCQGCRAYSQAVKRQRRALAIVLPVAPTLALRAATLRTVLGGAHGGATASAGTGAGLALTNSGGQALITKALAVVVCAAVGAGASTLALRAPATHHRGPHATTTEGVHAPRPFLRHASPGLASAPARRASAVRRAAAWPAPPPSATSPGRPPKSISSSLAASTSRQLALRGPRVANAAQSSPARDAYRSATYVPPLSASPPAGASDPAAQGHRESSHPERGSVNAGSRRGRANGRDAPGPISPPPGRASRGSPRNAERPAAAPFTPAAQANSFTPPGHASHSDSSGSASPGASAYAPGHSK